MRTVARLVLLVALVAFGLPAVASSSASAQAASAPAVSGRVLTRGGQLTSFAGHAQLLRSTLWCQGTFSPDGAMIASVVESVSYGCARGRIRIQRAHGATASVSVPAGNIRGITWSPDGKQLAVVVTHDNTAALYAVRVDGSGTQLLYSGYWTDAGSPEAEPAWSPDGSRIAYVGWSPVGHGQIYTVPAAGGTPAPFNTPYVDAGCDYESVPCRKLTFRAPRWSPDGTRLLVNASDTTWDTPTHPESWSSSAAILTEGATEPTAVRSIATSDEQPWAQYSADYLPVFWSADGSSVLVPNLVLRSPWSVDRSYTRTEIVSGRVTGVVRGEVYDWQPCPTGTCVSWPRAAKPRVAFTAFWKRTAFKHLRIAAKVAPRQQGFLRVEIQVAARGRWIPYLSKDIDISSGRVTRTAMASRDDPPGGACRAVATYRQVFRKVVRVGC
ncbi:hypothetical protein GCM10009795_027340 [Nocardioides hankookensis]|uniref:WD40-like Beta Propeller Repeat n=1 Tax=Nocardioides hankookensis TaxID=443157 RepID=A0ABW1LEP8_9ACTN